MEETMQRPQPSTELVKNRSVSTASRPDLEGSQRNIEPERRRESLYHITVSTL